MIGVKPRAVSIGLSVNIFLDKSYLNRFSNFPRLAFLKYIFNIIIDINLLFFQFSQRTGYKLCVLVIIMFVAPTM